MTKKLDEPSPVDRQMDVLCAQEGIPSFMAEVGHSEWAEPEYIDKTYEHGSYRDGWCDLYVQLVVKVEYGVSRTCGPM
mgnify:CR=1 FL=1